MRSGEWVEQKKRFALYRTKQTTPFACSFFSPFEVETNKVDGTQRLLFRCFMTAHSIHGGLAVFDPFNVRNLPLSLF
jgi:hypothetical protein